MGTITTGVGLISGLNIQQIVDQLIAVDARPRDLLAARVRTIDAQKTAWLDISARITAILSRVSALADRRTFDAMSATSSDPDVLGVTTGAGARPGSYSFVVRSLAAAQQLVSRGFSDRDATVGSGALTIESSQARVDRHTQLAELNGFAGVRRGAFKIRDGAGAEATININDAQTLADVLDRINSASTAVRASVQNEAIVLTDRNGGEIHLTELDGGHTAEDLGFAPGNTHATGALTGRTLSYLSDVTPLSGLEDGRGLRGGRGGSDFRVTNSAGGVFNVDLSENLAAGTRLERLNHGQGVQLGRIAITSRSGQRTEIDLTGLHTIGEVKDAIEHANAGVAVVLTGGKLLVSDTTNQTRNDLVIEDVNGGRTARDLGIAGHSSSTRLDGRQILRVDTLKDALLAINFADGNDGTVTASISTADRRRLVLTDNAGGTTSRVLLESQNGSHALRDLGFADGVFDADTPLIGRRIAGALDSTLLSTLNGGNGLTGGSIHIDANGNGADIDLSNAETLQQVIDAINAASTQSSLGIQAGLDPTGTRLALSNRDGGAATIAVSDLNGGTLAHQLGIDGSQANIRGANLQRQYISERTQLTALNGGRGVSAGKIRITDSNGHLADVRLDGPTIKTLGDVINEINRAGVGVRARINDTGDGLLLEDTAGGTAQPRVAELGGTIARDLNILGDGTNGRIDGAYEFHLDVQAGDSLDDVVRQINEKTTLASASVLNDGTSVSPFRLNIASRATGMVGGLLIDGSGLGLDFTTLTAARDARVLIGNDANSGVLVTSSSNTITNIVDGVTLTLTGVSDQPVQVTLDRNNQSMKDALSGLVSAFNSAFDRISSAGSYDPQTQQRGPLLGESALQSVQSRLYRLVTGRLPNAIDGIDRLGQLGIKVDDHGDLTFDEAKFQRAFDADPEGVAAAFTTATQGIAAHLKTELDGISSNTGLISRRNNTLDEQKTALNNRIDQLNELLDRKRTRLLHQFIAMEQALASLQGQQGALGSLSALGGGTSGASSSRG